MAKVHISPNRTTDKTIRAIDRKRENERRKMFHYAQEHTELFSKKLVQRLLDREIIETNSVDALQDVFGKQLRQMGREDEFELQLKLAPVRTLVQDPNIVSLYLTQFVIEELIDHPAIQDIFGEDLDIYRAIDSVMKVLRPQQ